MRKAYILLCLALLMGCRGAVTPPPAPESSDSGVIDVRDVAAASDIRIVPVRRRAMTESITATAIIEAEPSMVARVSPRIEARVVRLIAELGQRVKAGDPLAVLSSIEMGKAKTNYLKTKSLESIAAQHLEREQKLYAGKIASMKEVLNARGEHDSALAELQASREFLRSLLPDADIQKLAWSNERSRPLSEFTLVAPIEGTVVKRDLTPGAIVHDDADVLTIMNLDRMRVLVDIFEHDLAMVRLGAPANISVEAYPSARFTGTVASIGDTVDRTTRTVKARIDVDNPGHRLKPGMFANAEISATGATSSVLSVPSSAIFNLAGKPSVFVATSENRFTVTSVQVGESGGEDVQILSGLHEGDEVVAEGGLPLKAMVLNQVASH